MNHQTLGYMNSVHISENDMIYCIIEDDTADSLQCIHCLHLLNMTQLMLSSAIFVIINYYY